MFSLTGSLHVRLWQRTGTPCQREEDQRPAMAHGHLQASECQRGVDRWQSGSGGGRIAGNNREHKCASTVLRWRCWPHHRRQCLRYNSEYIRQKCRCICYFTYLIKSKIYRFSFQGVNKTFSGCIRTFMLNGQHVGEPSNSVGVIRCSKRIEPGMFFFPGNGSNWFRPGKFYFETWHINALINIASNIVKSIFTEDKYLVGRTMDINMEIKPRSSSGHLLSVHGRNDYLILEMVNGTVKFLVKTGKGQIETSFEPSSPNALCDGNWHNVRGTAICNFSYVRCTYSLSEQ